jgi:hypothetical protein
MKSLFHKTGKNDHPMWYEPCRGPPPSEENEEAKE